jgi:hypothetical protein
MKSAIQQLRELKVRCIDYTERNKRLKLISREEAITILEKTRDRVHSKIDSEIGSCPRLNIAYCYVLDFALNKIDEIIWKKEKDGES